MPWTLKRARRASLVASVFAPSAGGGGGTVLFDTSAISANAGSAGTSQNFSFSGGGNIALPIDIGSGSNGTSNRALLVALYFAGANAGTSSSPSVTWNGVSMTNVGGPYANGIVGDIYFFGLVNPDLGQHTLTANWTGSNQVGVAALSVVAADQTGGATTFKNATSNTGVGTTTSVAVTSLAGEMVMGAHMSGGNFSVAGNTNIGILNTFNSWATAANRDVGPNPTLTYTAGAGTWVSAGVSIKAA